MLVYDPSGIQRFFTLLMDPREERALSEDRFPITEVGIGRLIDHIADGAMHTSLQGHLRLIEHGEGEEAGRRVSRYELIFSDGPAPGYFCRKLLFAVDRESELPVRAVLYDWDGNMIGDYTYTNLQLNPGLARQEFDRANPTYEFP